MSTVLGWILVALGFATCATLASDNLDPQTGGNAMLLASFLFVLPGVWLIRRKARLAAKRKASTEAMADAIVTAIRKDREGR